jgi:hypothetical protein
LSNRAWGDLSALQVGERNIVDIPFIVMVGSSAGWASGLAKIEIGEIDLVRKRPRSFGSCGCQRNDNSRSGTVLCCRWFGSLVRLVACQNVGEFRFETL